MPWSQVIRRVTPDNRQLMRRKSFDNLTDRLVIDSVVSICRELGKRTVAEFVGLTVTSP